MKLLLDQNQSRRLAAKIANVYPDSVRSRRDGLRSCRRGDNPVMYGKFKSELAPLIVIASLMWVGLSVCTCDASDDHSNAPSVPPVTEASGSDACR